QGVLSSVGEYGKISIVFSCVVIFDVILSYGMETAFFRYFNKEEDQDKVAGTSAISLIVSSLGFSVLAFLFKSHSSAVTDIKEEYISLVIWILLLDALVIIPFAWLRAKGKSMRYAILKIVNVAINLGLNIFFLLYLKKWATHNEVLDAIYTPNFEINYIFISNLVASAVTLVLLLGFYFQ